MGQVKPRPGSADGGEQDADRVALVGSLPGPTTVGFVAEDQRHRRPVVEVALKFAGLLDRLAVYAAEKLTGAVRHDDVHRFSRCDFCKRDLWISSILVVAFCAKAKHEIVVLLAKREVSLVGAF